MKNVIFNEGEVILTSFIFLPNRKEFSEFLTFDLFREASHFIKSISNKKISVEIKEKPVIGSDKICLLVTLKFTGSSNITRLKEKYNESFIKTFKEKIEEESKNYIEARLIVLRDNSLIKKFTNTLPEPTKFNQKIQDIQKEIAGLHDQIKQKESLLKNEKVILLKESMDTLKYSDRVKDFLNKRIENTKEIIKKGVFMNLSTDQTLNCIILKTKTKALLKHFPAEAIQTSIKYIAGKKPETWHEVKIYPKTETEYQQKMDELKNKKLDKFILCHFLKK